MIIHSFRNSFGSNTNWNPFCEKHFTDDNDRSGPDHPFSMDPRTWKAMIISSRRLEQSLGDGKKKIEENERDTVILQRRSVRAKRLIKKGEKLLA